MDSQARTGRWIVKEERGGGGSPTKLAPHHATTLPIRISTRIPGRVFDRRNDTAGEGGSGCRAPDQAGHHEAAAA